MRNPFHRKNRYLHQDRIARDIADRHGMLDDYLAARRQGLSPLEALDDWDLLDEEARKMLNAKE